MGRAQDLGRSSGARDDLRRHPHGASKTVLAMQAETGLLSRLRPGSWGAKDQARLPGVPGGFPMEDQHPDRE